MQCWRNTSPLLISQRHIILAQKFILFANCSLKIFQILISIYFLVFKLFLRSNQNFRNHWVLKKLKRHVSWIIFKVQCKSYHVYYCLKLKLLLHGRSCKHNHCFPVFQRPIYFRITFLFRKNVCCCC